jgi:hypothetical protein
MKQRWKGWEGWVVHSIWWGGYMPDEGRKESLLFP